MHLPPPVFSLSSMTYNHYFDVPDAPEECLACGKALSEKQMEDGCYFCNENCKKELDVKLKTLAEGEEDFAQQEAEFTRKLLQEAQEAGFKDVEDYLISLRTPSPGRAPETPYEGSSSSPEEERLADFAFDADRERRFFGR